MAVTTPTECPVPGCDLTAAGPAGLASHMRSMHPEEWEEKKAAEASPFGRTPPGAPAGNGADGELRWEDPPGPGGKPTIEQRVTPLLPALRRGGGRWARLVDFEKPMAAAGAVNKLRKIETLVDIQWKGVRFPDGTSALYGRFAGEDEPEVKPEGE